MLSPRKSIGVRLTRAGSTPGTACGSSAFLHQHETPIASAPSGPFMFQLACHNARLSRRKAFPPPPRGCHTTPPAAPRFTNSFDTPMAIKATASNRQMFVEMNQTKCCPGQQPHRVPNLRTRERYRGGGEWPPGAAGPAVPHRAVRPDPPFDSFLERFAVVAGIGLPGGLHLLDLSPWAPPVSSPRNLALALGFRLPLRAQQTRPTRRRSGQGQRSHNNPVDPQNNPSKLSSSRTRPAPIRIRASAVTTRSQNSWNWNKSSSLSIPFGIRPRRRIPATFGERRAATGERRSGSLTRVQSWRISHLSPSIRPRSSAYPAYIRCKIWLGVERSIPHNGFFPANARALRS